MRVYEDYRRTNVRGRRERRSHSMICLLGVLKTTCTIFAERLGDPKRTWGRGRLRHHLRKVVHGRALLRGDSSS